MALGIWNKFSLWLEHILGGTALILGLKEVTEAAVEAVATPVLIKPVIGLEVSPVIEGTYVGHSKLGQVLFTAEDVEDNGEVVLDDVDKSGSIITSSSSTTKLVVHPVIIVQALHLLPVGLFDGVKRIRRR